MTYELRPKKKKKWKRGREGGNKEGQEGKRGEIKENRRKGKNKRPIEGDIRSLDFFLMQIRHSAGVWKDPTLSVNSWGSLYINYDFTHLSRFMCGSFVSLKIEISNLFKQVEVFSVCVGQKTFAHESMICIV